MKRYYKLIAIFITFIFIFLNIVSTVIAKPPIKSKFYDFDEQIVDGERRKPTILYTNAREAVKFERLLKMKKSFIPKLFKTSKERVFK